MDSDDKKITQLSPITALSDSDLFVVVVNVGTAPETRSMAGSKLPSVELLANDIFRCNPGGVTSLWTGTINGAPSGANVTVTTSTGNIAAITPFAGTYYGKIRIYNLTRGNYALISSVSGSVITLTATAPGTWANTDSLTCVSQTVSGTYNWMDIEITSGITRSHIFMEQLHTASTANTLAGSHPLESFSFSKIMYNISQVANQNTIQMSPFLLTGGVYSIFWQVNTTTFISRYKGYLR